MEIINIAEAKAHLSKLIEMAMKGKEVIIGKRNHPLVRLIPLKKHNLKKRKGGYLKGEIHMAPDFDHLPKEIEEAFNGLHS